jgi:GxxExxY protein
MADIPHEDLTYKIIGAAMRVHNQLGPGLKEIMYQRALSSAFAEAGLGFEEEKPYQVTLEGEQVGLVFLDHLVEDNVVVEEKAFAHLLTDEEVAQVITYLAISNVPVGLLLNFGRKKLEYKRILPRQKFEDWRARAGRYAWRPEEAAKANPLIRSSSVDRADSRSPSVPSTGREVRS